MMKTIKVLTAAALVGGTGAIFAGCNSSASILPHKLVATSGESTVPLYPDEQTYLKVSHSAQEGGITGVAGNVQKSFVAKQINNQTPVKILSSDSNGSEVEITQGAMKGQAGFVAAQNVD
ncbi:MAG TPA: hypothetical protein VMF50_13900 [Candidatus Binataceae bacterium]|nr:hypothetical protein [Candidatus Binataceae bacterium]